MEQMLYQCCYTKGATGWCNVAVSDNIPANLLAMCKNIQGDHSRMKINGKTFNSLDYLTQEGTAQTYRIYEIGGDDKNKGLYFCVSAYGSKKDAVNRESMFSHAFLLKAEDDILEDPNTFLTIGLENFKTETEEAEKIGQIRYNEPYEIHSALQKTGLTEEQYRELVQSVYYQLVRCYNKEPVYMGYDGTPEQMMALLYCIYYGIPYHLRKLLRAATATTIREGSRDIILTDKPAQHKVHIDYSVNQNTLLTADARKKIPEFIRYAVDDLDISEFSAYYGELERIAQSMGVAAVGEKREMYYTLAYKYMTGPKDCKELDNAELTAVFNLCAGVAFAGNPVLESYTACLLTEMSEREILMSEETENLFEGQKESITSQDLQNAYKKYDTFRFSVMPKEQVAYELAKPGMFQTYAAALLNTKNGQAILELYYDNLLASGMHDIPMLEKELDNIRFIPDRSNIIRKIEETALGICREALAKKNTAESLSICYTRIRQYILLLEKIYSNQETEILRKSESIIREFWQDIRYPDIVLNSEAKQFYKGLECNLSGIEWIFDYLEFVNNTLMYDEATLSDKLFVRFNRMEFRNLKEKAQTFERLIQFYKSRNMSLSEDLEVILSVVVFLQNTEDKDLLMQIYGDAVRLQTEDEIKHESLIAGLERLFERIQMYRYDPELIRKLIDRICGIVTRLLLSAESSSKTRDEENALCIPVDVWLTIGEYSSEYSNVFEIFDVLSTSIVEYRAEDVVDDTVRMGREDIILQAEEYIKSGAQNSKEVKSWYSAYTKQLKKQKKDQEKNAKKEKAAELKAEKEKAPMKTRKQKKQRDQEDPQEDFVPEENADSEDENILQKVNSTIRNFFGKK